MTTPTARPPDEVVTTFCARRVDMRAGGGSNALRTVLVQAEWMGADETVRLLVVPVVSDDGDDVAVWETTAPVRKPPGVEWAGWYERAVGALTDLNAEAHFAFSFSGADDDDDAALKWTWHERTDGRATGALDPPLRLDAADKVRNIKRVASAALRRSAAPAGPRVVRCLERLMRRDEDVRRENAGLKRDIAHLRRAVDAANDQLRAAATNQEAATRDTLGRVVLLVNAKKERIRKLEDELQAAREYVAGLERDRDRDAADDDDDDDDEMDVDTEDEREQAELAKRNAEATARAAETKRRRKHTQGDVAQTTVAARGVSTSGARSGGAPGRRPRAAADVETSRRSVVAPEAFPATAIRTTGPSGSSLMDDLLAGCLSQGMSQGLGMASDDGARGGAARLGRVASAVDRAGGGPSVPRGDADTSPAANEAAPRGDADTSLAAKGAASKPAGRERRNRHRVVGDDLNFFGTQLGSQL